MSWSRLKEDRSSNMKYPTLTGLPSQHQFRMLENRLSIVSEIIRDQAVAQLVKRSSHQAPSTLKDPSSSPRPPNAGVLLHE